MNDGVDEWVELGGKGRQQPPIEKDVIAYQQILVEKNKATAQALSSRPQNGRFGNPQRPLGFEPWYSSQRGRRPQ